MHGLQIPEQKNYESSISLFHLDLVEFVFFVCLSVTEGLMWMISQTHALDQLFTLG